MPTNILRRRGTAVTAREGRPAPTGARRVLITMGRVAIRAELLATPTAERIWMQLPIFSTAETWGQAVLAETPVETGRERGARVLVEPGDICFLAEDDRIVLAFGPTPISRPGEIRLPRPCNVWAKALDDVAPLKDVAAGEKVSVTAA